LISGWIGMPEAIGGGDSLGKFLEPVFHLSTVEATNLSKKLEPIFMILSFLVALFGVFSAWFVYGLKHKISPALLKLIPGGPQTLEKKYYVDELYEASVVKGVKALAHWVSDRLVEQIMVNGLVHLVTETATGLSRWAQKSQTGLVRIYLAYVAVGAALLIYWMTH